MPLIKDILNNLSKTLTQVEKSNLQIEKTISSSKTSIKNIKDVSSNIKELKANNDKYNKAFEEFNLNQNQLSKKINKYLENPTPEKALKLKYQINVSNDYLAKATTVFSDNKTSSEKVINSFNKYKNGDFISNAEQLIKLNSRLNPSFTKLINSVNKLKTKTQIKAKTKAKNNTQTRKVYLHNETSPDPTCEAKKKEIAAIMKIIDSLHDRTASNYFKMIELTILFKILEAKLDKQQAELSLQLSLLDDIIKVYTPLVDAYKEASQRVQDDNIFGLDILTRLNLDLAQAIADKNNKEIKDIEDNIASSKARMEKNIVDFQQAIVNLGPISTTVLKKLNYDYAIILEQYSIESDIRKDKLGDSNREISNLQSMINVDRLQIKGYKEDMQKLEEYTKEHCP
jgi:hypothetical protein